MIIAVTGTPGTGKTGVARELARLYGYKYVNLNRTAEKEGLVTGVDPERHSKIIDTDRLGELLVPDDSVVDGHLSHFVLADIIVVLRTRPDILERRLKKRKWSRKKIGENLEAEILGTCSSEAFESGEKVLEFDTSKGSGKKAAKTIKGLIDNNEDTEDIDWLEKYEKMLIR
ncbi:MAG: adenylate kinase family protein [archaeon]|nr:MAG: adenylate kinase family protein [archaeon]